MILWLRVRRAGTCFATIVAVALGLIPVRELSVPLPNLLGPGLAVPLALLLPVAVSIMVAWGLTAGDVRIESVATRSISVLDTLFALSAATLTLIACALVRLIGETDLAIAAGRNALGYIGLMLIGRRVLGNQAAAVVPAGFVVVTALFGRGVGRPSRWWAWPLAAANNWYAWMIAVGLLSMGAVVALKRRNVDSTDG